ncbi:MAG: AMP nucleosidase, partial [Pseudomonadota bacterium]
MNVVSKVNLKTPDVPKAEAFTDAAKAVTRLQELYQIAVRFLSDNFSNALKNGQPKARVRAYYPEIRLTTTTYAKTDTRL